MVNKAFAALLDIQPFQLLGQLTLVFASRFWDAHPKLRFSLIDFHQRFSNQEAERSSPAIEVRSALGQQ